VCAYHYTQQRSNELSAETANPPQPKAKLFDAPSITDRPFDGLLITVAIGVLAQSALAHRSTCMAPFYTYAPGSAQIDVDAIAPPITTPRHIPFALISDTAFWSSLCDSLTIFLRSSLLRALKCRNPNDERGNYRLLI